MLHFIDLNKYTCFSFMWGAHPEGGASELAIESWDCELKVHSNLSAHNMHHWYFHFKRRGWIKWAYVCKMCNFILPVDAQSVQIMATVVLTRGQNKTNNISRWQNLLKWLLTILIHTLDTVHCNLLPLAGQLYYCLQETAATQADHYKLHNCTICCNCCLVVGCITL